MGCGPATGDAQLQEWAMFFDGTRGLFSSGPLLRRCGWEWRFLISPTCSHRQWCWAEEVVSLVSNKQFPDLRYTPRKKPYGV